jgi:hypothetical protein
MAIYTLAELETEISTYKTALTGLADGKTITMADKTLTRHDIPAMRDHLQWLDNQRSQLTATGGISAAPVGRTYASNGRGR